MLGLSFETRTYRFAGDSRALHVFGERVWAHGAARYTARRRFHVKRSPLGLILVLAALGACAEPPTAIRLVVDYDEDWPLDDIRVSMGYDELQVAAQHELVLEVPDRAAGRGLEIDLTGLREGIAWARGAITVVPELDEEVTAHVRLTREVCGGEAPLVCDDAPASECVAPDTLRVFENVGACANGVCAYESHDLACNDCPHCDACAEVSCSSPPPPACVDSTTLRTYADAGTCTDGACDYAFTDSTCASGCAGGACITGCTPAGWSTPELVGPSLEDSTTSLAVDTNDGLHVAFTGSAGGTRMAMYAGKPGLGPWGVSILESTGYRNPVVAIGGGGPEVVHARGTALRLAVRQTNGAWTRSDVVDTFGTGDNEYGSPTYQVTASGERLLAYHHIRNPLTSGTPGLRFASRSAVASSWTRQTIQDGDGDYTASALAPDGTMHLVARHNNSSTGDAHLDYWMRNPNGVWTDSFLAQGSFCTDNAIALDANLTAHIACRNNSGVRYMRRTAVGAWSTTMVDGNASVGGREGGIGITVDRFDRVHIVYEDFEDGALREATGNGTTWALATIAQAGGSNASLRTDHAGRMHLVYVTADGVEYRAACPGP